MTFTSLKLGLSPILFVLMASLMLFDSCVKKEKGCTDPTALNFNPDASKDDGSCITGGLPIPTEYNFGRWGQTTVDKSRPIMQQLLINDLLIMIDQAGEPGGLAFSDEDLISIFEASIPTWQIGTSVIPYEAISRDYSSIASTVTTLQTNISKSYLADSLIYSWFDTLATNCQDLNKLGNKSVHLTNNGLDLRELVYHTFLGALVFYQGVNRITNISTIDNSSLIISTNSTTRELAWDRAFGYFGASNPYGNLLDEDINEAASPATDSNSDGLIDFESEFNFPYSVFASQRDQFDNNSDGTPSGTDFSGDLNSAFLGGRTSITNKNDSLQIVYSVQASNLWEQLIAANCIHYVNLLNTALSENDGSEVKTYAISKYWSIVYATILSFQYNEFGQFQDPEDLLDLIGTSPNFSLAGTTESQNEIANLILIKEKLAVVYSFSNEQLEAW